MRRDKKNVMGERIIEPKITLASSFFSTAIAILLFILGLFVITNGLKFEKNGVKVEATVTNIINDETERKIIIKYEVNGEAFVNELGYWNEELDLHDTIEILALEDDPLSISTPGNYSFLSIMIFIISIVIFVFSFRNIYKYYKEENRVYNLLKNGNRRVGKVYCVEALDTTSIYVYNAWALTATISDKVYNSKKFWLKNSPKNIESCDIDIYIDNNDEENYYIDLWSVKVTNEMDSNIY